MHTFSIRNLREKVGDIVADAEAGQLSLITKRGKPIFLAVPFDENMFQLGLHAFLAVEAYKVGSVSLEKAAKMASLSVESFMERLSEYAIPVVNYPAEEVQDDFDRLQKFMEK